MVEDAAAQNDMHAIYQIAKKVTGGSRARLGLIKAKDGTLLSGGEDKVSRWAAEHFNEVFNSPASTISIQVKDPLDTIPISTEKFTEAEIRKAIKALKNKQSPCMDGISAEMLKAGGKNFDWCPHEDARHIAAHF